MMRPKRRATEGTCISELKGEREGGTAERWPGRAMARVGAGDRRPAGRGGGQRGALPEVPEEEVADLAVGQRPVQQELGQLAVEVGFVLEHLHQLQQVLEKLVVPAEEEAGLT